MAITRERITAPPTAPELESPAARRGWVGHAAMVAALLAAVVYGMWPVLQRPAPLGLDAPAEAFSAGRAMEDVAVIARRPHPARSDAMHAVADHLASELRAAGVEVQRQETEGLHNVVGRIRGTEPTGAVLFVSHADSVPDGPGAGDNATGAATLVEMARALTAGQPLPNDVIVLLEDGEELGFLGGWAFATDHPWMADVRAVVGLDIGAWGPPHVSQTSNDDGVVVRAYADEVRRPLAFGFFAGADADSDYETAPFRARGLPAMEIEDNYANVDQHTARDTADRVDPGRVQQLGDQALDLARALGRVDLAEAEAPSRVFHTFAGIGVVHYPVSWDVVLVGLSVLAFAAVVMVGVRTRRLTGRRILAGAGLGLALVLGVTLAAVGLVAIYDAWEPNPNPNLAEYLLPSSAPFAVGAYTLLAVLFGLGYWRLGRRVGWAELAIGFLGLATLLTVVLVLALPGSEYPFMWPELLALGTWLWVLLRPAAPRVLFAVPALLMVMLAAPLLPDGYFGAGIANLPTVASTNALFLGALLVPAFTIRPAAVRR